MPDGVPMPRGIAPLRTWVGVVIAAGLWTGARSEDDAPQKKAAPPGPSQAVQRPDTSGHKRVGVASVYAKRLAGKAMAAGAPMNPQGDNAASKTLPLGTTARVTNLANGHSASVSIQDRGPYVKGRIVDLSPSTARQIGITPEAGVAKVAVVPIAIPLPDGSVKPGAAAHGATFAGSAAADRKK